MLKFRHCKANEYWRKIRMDISQLLMAPIYENQLDMQCFARMLESPTQSYKFYWLEAILTLLPEKDEMTFEEIIYEMFWEAWYTVSQYHLHLGPAIGEKSENLIEHAVHIIENDPDVKLPMLREQFMVLLEKNWDTIKSDVNGLIKNVPYRLLSSFMKEVGGNDRIWDQKKRLISYLELLNQKVHLPYVIIDGRGAQKRIHIDPLWRHMLLDNYTLVKSWIQMKKVRFLQDRNPGVPGIIYKLESEEAKGRKLDKVRDLWLTYEVVSGTKMHDLYSGERIPNDKFSIDHFIPWSFVTCDELWNLVPMDKSNNSSKGNRLPEWKLFFPRLASIQYDLYKVVFSDDQVFKIFEDCKRYNLNAMWASELLYVPGNSQERFANILENNLKPIYDGARYQGYAIWKEPLNY